MHSAIDEYCPIEFNQLLDAIDELEKRSPFCIGSTIFPGLSKLIEECGEVCQVAGKLMATGGESKHWDGSDLRQRLMEELADLSAAIDFVICVNGLDTVEIITRTNKKFDQFHQWHKEQQRKEV